MFIFDPNKVSTASMESRHILTSGLQTRYDLPNLTVKGSVAWLISKDVTLIVSIVLLCITASAYFYFFHQAQQSLIQELVTFVKDRSHFELTQFNKAQSNLDIAQTELVSSLSYNVDNFDSQRDSSLTYPSNAIQEVAPSTYTITPKNSYLTPINIDQRKKVEGIISRFGPAWQKDYQDLYFVSKNDYSIRYTKNNDYLANINTSYTHLDKPFFVTGTPAINPKRVNTWTDIYWDSTSNTWLMSNINPVYINNNFIGVLGHDARVSEFIERNNENSPYGATNILLNTHGRLISHPEYMDKIQFSTIHYGGYYLSQNSDKKLKRIATLIEDFLSQPKEEITANENNTLAIDRNTIHTQDAKVFVIKDSLYDRYIVFRYLPKFDWYFVSEYPNSIIESKAFHDARIVLIIGFFLLVIKLTVIFLILNKKVTRPIKDIIQTVSRWDKPHSADHLKPYWSRDDELGQLAIGIAAMQRLINQQLMKLNSELFNYSEQQRNLEDRKSELENQIRRTKSDLALANEKLSQINLYDNLTQLPNRQFFIRQISQAVSACRRHDSYCAIMIINIDNFKSASERVGHSGSNQILVDLAERLRSILRKEDTLSRLDGDEFGILLEHTKNTIYLGTLAKRLATICALPFEYNEKIVSLTVSNGIAIFPKDTGDEPTEKASKKLLQFADIAMHQAKSIGNNMFQFYDHDTMETATRKLIVSQLLHDAINKEQFYPVFQPIYDTKTRNIVAFESLVRWNHPDEGLIMPNDFIDVAEKTNLIGFIDFIMLELVCHFLDSHREVWPTDVYITVNFSSKHLLRERLVSDFTNLIERYKISNRWIAIEITETCLLDDEKSLQNIKAIQSLGFHVILDDFGTGYSALNYLQKVNFSVIKIDRRFVSELPDDHFSRTIISTIIEMAKKLDMRVVAEGVETPQQIDHLKSFDCNYLQGYYFSKPVKASDAIRLIQSNHKKQQSV